MPFLKFSRDKRGYEHTYLMHSVARRGKPARTRILYWYRTPPGVRVGRPAFDEEVRRTIEARHPGVVFDWDALASTPIPPPDQSEQWRERRRLEKAAKAARRQEEAEAALDAAEPADSAGGSELASAGDDAPALGEGEAESGDSAVTTAGASAAAPGGRRRRRRGGRRRANPAVPQGTRPESTDPEPPSAAPDSSSEEQ